MLHTYSSFVTNKLDSKTGFNHRYASYKLGATSIPFSFASNSVPFTHLKISTVLRLTSPWRHVKHPYVWNFAVNLLSCV